MARVSPPKGTRDLYPLEAARRRWLTERWRRVAIRHGFEEVDGPTFETCDLYAVKSGEGILGELFQAFSGKDPRDIEAIRGGGAAPFAMRPEFTPSLARMYAERARSLPKPFKCFQIGPFFRAERPQRGRLREFLQWNVDILGGSTTEGTESTEEKARLDAELIACSVALLASLGLTSDNVAVRVSDRTVVAGILTSEGVQQDQLSLALSLLDRSTKMDPVAFHSESDRLGLPTCVMENLRTDSGVVPPSGREGEYFETAQRLAVRARPIREFVSSLEPSLQQWVKPSLSIVRGLAYYTGTVFEVIADGERAIAGGGRYDNLIELFGGPPTPAVGFAMGDVVISLLLQDKGLMPSDRELIEEIGARPDAFVIAPSADLDHVQSRLLSTLRREGLHARRSYKSTRNVGKLLSEAGQQHARCAIIVESHAEVSVKLLDGKGEQERVPIAELTTYLRERLTKAH